jgi:protein TonB
MPALLQERGEEGLGAATDSPGLHRDAALFASNEPELAPAPDWAPRPRASHEESASSLRISRILSLAMTLFVHLGMGAFLILAARPQTTRAELAPPAIEDTQMTWVDLSPEPPPVVAPILPPPPEPPRVVAKPKASPAPARAPEVEPEPVPEATMPEPVAVAPTPSPAPVEPVVAEVTPPPTPIETPTPPLAKPVSAAQARREQNAYVRALMAWLLKYRVYPDAAKKDKAQGVVQVRFTIDRGGRVLASSVQKSGGHAALDAAALDVLSRASPVPPMPDSMRMSKLTITLPIEYSLIKD